MKNKILILIVIFISNISFIKAQTTIGPGYVSGTWTKPGSPYEIQGDITVDTLETLIIEPGVKIIFQGNYTFTVDGILSAIGEKTDRITFTAIDTLGYPNSYTGWGGIIIREKESWVNDTSKFIFCTFNYGAGIDGGAIFTDKYNRVLISDCIFRYNNAEDNGGAMFIWQYSEVSIINNTFLNNTANGWGGALYVSNSDPEIIGNLIAYNEANQGGGLYFNGSNSYFVNNTITYNIAYYGGGIMYSGENCQFYNTIIWNNTATEGDQIYLPVSKSPAIYNSNIQGGKFSFAGEPFNNDYIDCIDIDPEFIDPSGFDFQLGLGSMCINSGENSIPFIVIPETDIEGDSRIYSGDVPTIDMGAYEYQGEPVNRPPYVDDIANKNMFPNTSSDFNFSYLDFDYNDNISISITSDNANVTGQILTDSTFRLTTLNYWKGTAGITMTFTDNQDEETSAEFSVTVGNVITNDIYEDTYWSGDTVFIANNITVHDGATLYISPGTRVVSTGFYGLFIDGSLHASGTLEEPIIFTVNDTSGYHTLTHTGWDGIDFSEVSGSNPTSYLIHCIIEYAKSTTSYVVGGALDAYHTNEIIIQSSTFRFNYSQGGPGAIRLYYSNIKFINNYIYNNYCQNSNGAIMISACNSIIFRNNCIANNGSESSGLSGLNIIDCHPTIENSNIVYNWGGQFYGGVTLRNAETIFLNCILGYNGDEVGGEIVLETGSTAEFKYCDVVGGDANFTYSGGTIYYDTTNIDDDPLFVNPPSINTHHVSVPLVGFQLSPFSPCIDAGIPDEYGIYQYYTDIIGQNRAVNDTVDIGCFEFYNYLPQFTSLPDIQVGQDVDLEYSIAELVVDSTPGDVLSYQATRLDEPAFPAWISFDETTGIFSGSPAITDLDTLTIEISVQDLLLETAVDTFILYVVENEKPVLYHPLQDRTFMEDAYTSIQFPDSTFVEYDINDSLCYTLFQTGGSEIPEWLHFNDTALRIEGIPSNEDVGMLELVLRARDTRFAYTQDTFNLEVINTNDSPILINALIDQTATAFIPFDYSFPENSFYDEDAGDILNYSAELNDGSNIPGWLTFTPGSRNFSGTPANEDAGEYTIKVIAFDVALEEASGNFILTVNPSLAVKDNAENKPFNLFPNPADHVLYIQNLNEEEVILYIYNQNGQLLYSGNIPLAVSEIDISKFHSGIYLVELISRTNIYIEKIVKE